jgi:glutamate-1-semialdehyde aminotransferase
MHFFNSRTKLYLEIPTGPVNNFVDASKSDMAKFAKWHREMLKRGVYLAPSQYEAGFTSLAHTEEDIDSLTFILLFSFLLSHSVSITSRLKYYL